MKARFIVRNVINQSLERSVSEAAQQLIHTQEKQLNSTIAIYFIFEIIKKIGNRTFIAKSKLEKLMFRSHWTLITHRHRLLRQHKQLKCVRAVECNKFLVQGIFFKTKELLSQINNLCFILGFALDADRW